MRMRWLLCGVLCLLAMAPTARAGLYLPMKPSPWPLPTSPKPFLYELTELQGVAILATPPPDGSKVKVSGFAERVQKKLPELEKHHKEGKLSLEEALDLSGCYLLMGKTNNAIDVLTAILAQHPKHFMVLANLANAYQGIGETRRAADYQAQVLSNWPREVAGWSSEQLWWYRRAEKYYLALLESRNRERLLQKPANTLDNLFPGAPFTDPKVKYRVGGIDVRARDRLPPDVLPLVEQLVLWMPQDSRLIWMYAEVMNARGEVAVAADVMSNKLGFNRSMNSKLFKDHRRELEAKKSDPKFKRSQADFTPDISPTFPGLTKKKQEASSSSSAQNSSTPQGTDTWIPSWRQLGVGFGSGLIVGMLLLLQIGQLRRRFSGSRSSSSPG